MKIGDDACNRNKVVSSYGTNTKHDIFNIFRKQIGSPKHEKNANDSSTYPLLRYRAAVSPIDEKLSALARRSDALSEAAYAANTLTGKARTATNN